MANFIEQKQFRELKKLIDYHIGSKLQGIALQDLSARINQFLRQPTLDDYYVEVLVHRLLQLGADFEYYVQAYMFKSMPDDYTRRELSLLEDELFAYIEKKLIGKPLEQKITHQLIAQLHQQQPEMSKEKCHQKAMGNWAWLIPHMLILIIMQQLFRLIKDAILKDKQVNRKGRIRIKKM